MKIRHFVKACKRYCDWHKKRKCFECCISNEFSSNCTFDHISNDNIKEIITWAIANTRIYDYNYDTRYGNIAEKVLKQETYSIDSEWGEESYWGARSYHVSRIVYSKEEAIEEAKNAYELEFGFKKPYTIWLTEALINSYNAPSRMSHPIWSFTAYEDEDIIPPQQKIVVE